MRIVLQKVTQASVTVDDQRIAAIDRGYLLLVGIKEGDSQEEADYLIRKISHLRVFEDQNDKLNLSIHDVAGSILSVSQFTLYANTKKGNRPSFTRAASPEKAVALFNYFNQGLLAEKLPVVTGQFGAHMKVELENDGPVTIIFDTDHK